MSLLETARDALKELPLSDIVRERLSLALDRLAEAESKIEVLQTENGSLKSQFERERLDHHQTREEVERLKQQLAEEVRFHRGVEFHRGKRTGGKWVAFCPICHAPAEGNVSFVTCPNPKCKWMVTIYPTPFSQVLEELQ